MATHSSVIVWRIPEMGEPGGLPSMGLRRVGHDWSDLAAYKISNGYSCKELCRSIMSWCFRSKVDISWIYENVIYIDLYIYVIYRSILDQLLFREHKNKILNDFSKTVLIELWELLQLYIVFQTYRKEFLAALDFYCLWYCSHQHESFLSCWSF